MPYYINCPRCNVDNTYSQLGGKCSKCDGLARDWRDDNELESYHSWAGITIDDLKSNLNHNIERNGFQVFFVYKDSIPKHSIKKEIEEIKKEVNFKEPIYISQIFCTHNWSSDYSQNKETCNKCEKSRALKKENTKEGKFEYNRFLNDTEKFFPNRCYACEEYSNTRSPNGNPLTGDDLVFCNIGGTVRADEGCEHFKPDNTAECSSCWNFLTDKNGNPYHCDIKGQLTNMIWGGCLYHVEKEKRIERE